MKSQVNPKESVFLNLLVATESFCICLPAELLRRCFISVISKSLPVLIRAVAHYGDITTEISVIQKLELRLTYIRYIVSSLHYKIFSISLVFSKHIAKVNRF